MFPNLKILFLLLLMVVVNELISMIYGSFPKMKSISSSDKKSSKTNPLLDRIVIVVRHGDRAPINPILYNESKMLELWPCGLGQLSTPGKLRMYQLGVFLRQRYSKEFPNEFISPRDVYIRSSPLDRTLESSQLISAGLCPPKGSWIWKPDLGTIWQPVPILTTERLNDGLLNPASSCEVADLLQESIPQSPIVKNYMAAHQELLQNISTLIESKILLDHRGAREVFDNILALRHHGHHLPHWITPTVYEKLKHIFHTSFIFDYTSLIKPDLKKLRAGVLLNEIFTKLNPNVPAKKLSIYVTHDSQLFHLLDGLGFNMQKMNIKFGSMLLFEYNKRLDDFHLFIINNAHPWNPIEPMELKIPLCEQNLSRIPLYYLVNKYKSLFITLEQWKKLCQNVPLFSQQYNNNQPKQCPIQKIQNSPKSIVLSQKFNLKYKSNYSNQLKEL